MPNGSMRPIPAPLPSHLVDFVRAHGWELAPAGWLRRQLDDRDRLRQQLAVRAAKPTRIIRAGPRDQVPGSNGAPLGSRA